MDQEDSDWNLWPEKDQNDPMMTSIKSEILKDEDSLLQLEDAESGVGEEEDNLSGSADSEESGDEDVKVEQNGSMGIPNGERSYYFQSIQEGMATCEFCGRMGVKHAFYSKSKRFCSLSCSKSYSAYQKDKKKHPDSGTAQPKSHTKKKSKASKQEHSFDWCAYLNETQATAAPVSCFKHCPMADSWDNITMGMKVEVINTDCNLNDVYWIATVVKLAGYKALMRYEGFGNDPSKDFWINLCKEDVHPVGWCATTGKPLVPPQTIQQKYMDWKDFLVKRLTGARTLPNNFYNKVIESINEHPVKKGKRVEVVDKMCVSAMRVATVDEVIGGRLRLHYDDSRFGSNDEFWCHRESALVHPIGWSQLVGHKLHAVPEYKTESLNKIAFKKYDEQDTTPEMFAKNKDMPANGLKFLSGMKLEAIDPLNLASICVATVMKVLRNNYLMIGIDGSMAENGSDWFCYHATSPCIFPAGFCEINNIKLTPPRGYKGEFKWFDYLKQTRSVAAPVKLFDKEIPKHGFRRDMKLEAVDLMEPRLICVSTITKVVGRLLRIHFDGWEAAYDQWIDCESPDIYPVGWCEMVAYHLEGPKKKKVPTATLR